MDLISLAAWRTLPALLMYLGLLVVSGQWNELLHLPSHLLLRLLLSTLVGLAVGDLFYFRSMKLIDLARTPDISKSFLSVLEPGKRSFGAERVREVEAALDVSVRALYGELGGGAL